MKFTRGRLKIIKFIKYNINVSEITQLEKNVKSITIFITFDVSVFLITVSVSIKVANTMNLGGN